MSRRSKNSPAPKRLWRRLAPLLIAVATAAAYRNSFTAPLVFDGVTQIENNADIRQLWPPWGWLTHDRRPVAYLTFAVNYAVHGLNVWGYHAVNLAIHIAAALILWGILRRSLRAPRLPPSYQAAAEPFALAAALVWAVHPLQTQSVTYLVQRIEALMGMFFLLTLYAFIRDQEENAPRRWWLTISVACCGLGAATKEVAAMAPLLVLWYDRVFVALSWRDLWLQRRGYYAALFATWGLLAYLMISQWHTYGDRAVAVEGLTPLNYALSQPGVVLHYLRLSFWPANQCLDYGWPVADTLEEILPPMLGVLILLSATFWCMARRPEWGFLGGWFFLILAPTSTIVPIDDLAFEHRMYLPLAAVCVAAMLAGERICRGLQGSGNRAPGRNWLWWLIAVPVMVVALAWATVARNEDYRDELTVWSDVVETAPWNPRGHLNLGYYLLQAGRHAEAISRFQHALRLDNQLADAHVFWGMALRETGNLNGALRQFRAARRIDAEHLMALLYTGMTLRQLGDLPEANEYFARVRQLNPDFVPAYVNWGVALLDEGQYDAAAEQFEHALSIDEGHVPAHLNLGNVRREQGRLLEAVAHYRRALEIDPRYAKARYNLGNVLRDLGRLGEAVEQFRLTLQADPHHAGAQNNWGVILHSQGRYDEAIPHFREALRIDPHNAPARQSLVAALVNLGVAAQRAGNRAAALQYFEDAVQADPSHSIARQYLHEARTP